MSIAPTDIVIRDLGKGVDTYSALDSLEDGAHRVLRNVDPKSNGSIETRKGFQRYYGGVPLRATRVAKSGTTITLEFDSSQTISLVTSGQGPVIVAGKLPPIPGVTGAGDLGTDFRAVWYPGLSLTFKESLPSGSDIPITKSPQQTGWTTSLGMVGLARADSSVNASNTVLNLQSMQIDQASLDIEMTYTSGTNFTGYFYYLETPAETGRTYIKAITTADGTSIVIPASEHALNTLNIIPMLFEDDGANNVQSTPETVDLDSAGQLTLTMSVPMNGYIVLYAADPLKTYTAAAAPGTTVITIPGIEAPFNFYSIWYTQAGVRHQVAPAKISWNSVTQETNIEYFLGEAAETVEIFWAEGNFTANVIAVQDTTGTVENYVAEDAEISVYGIPHEGIYKLDAPRGGWTNHIDSYRSELEAKVVTGLGGNVFQGLSREEGGQTYIMPQYRLMSSMRAVGDNRLAPLFAPSDSTWVRTRGLIKDASINAHGALLTRIEYAFAGSTRLYFSFDAKDPISWTNEIGPGDLITVERTGKAANSGTFRIDNIVLDSPTELVLLVDNPAATKASRVNEGGIRARGNVYTDVLNATGNQLFKGDRLVSVATNISFEVESWLVGGLLLKDIRSQLTLPDGVNVYAIRTSRCLLLSQAGATVVSGLVRGDSLRMTGLARRLTVRNINRNVTQTVSGDIVDGVLVVTMPDHGFNPGQYLLSYIGSDASLIGEVQVQNVVDEDTFTLALSTPEFGDTRYLSILGHTVEIDEALTYSTGPGETLVSVDGRWATIENPSSGQDRVVRTKERHFDESSYTTQPYIKSSMANDSLYLTNSLDEVKKFDGSAIYNAGIPPWQPWLFLSTDSSVPAIYGGREVAYTAVNFDEKFFEIATPSIPVGSRFREEVTGVLYTVTLLEQDLTTTPVSYRAYVAETIDPLTASSGALQLPNRHRYYVKVDMIDRNGNIMSGPTLGADDLYVDLFASSTIVLKVLGLPAYEELDYDRLQISVFRTAANTLAPFYRTRTVQVDYSDLGGYIVIKDTTPDAAFTLADLDPTISVLTGGELGTRWNIPPKAASATTASNRLILLNIKSPPLADVVFRKQDLIAATDLGDYAGGEITIIDTQVDPAARSANNGLNFTLETASLVIDNILIGTDNVTIETVAAHGRAAGNWVYLFHSSTAVGRSLDFSGWFRISEVTDANTFIVETLHTRTPGAGTAFDINRVCISTGAQLTANLRVPIYLGVDGNYGQYIGSFATLESTVATRLSLAINAVMATEAPSNPYWVNAGLMPKPWLRAGSGKSYRDGAIDIQLCDAPSGQFEIRFYDMSSNVETFVNDLRYGLNDPALSEIRLFPSRLVKSYPNFPEIMDDPYGPEGGDSVIDIDPDDGQEGVVAIPFFGSSVFGAAQLTQAVVVFKSNSVHLVNVETGERQKLQTNGQGCTAPRSVTVTRNGIFFVNASGVYRLGWDMQCSWVGRNLKGEFDVGVALDQLGDMAGHNYAQGRQYKLSFTVPGRDKNSDVFCYDHSREELGQPGAWSIYDNHDATGWTNLGQQAYWGSTRGLVYQVRSTGTSTDYRDDASPIPGQTIETGGMEFGLPGQRKVALAVTYHFSCPDEVTGVELFSEQSLSGNFLTAGMVQLPEGENSVRFSLEDRMGTHLRLRLTKEGEMDEKLIVSKLSIQVAPLGGQGLVQQQTVAPK